MKLATLCYSAHRDKVVGTGKLVSTDDSREKLTVVLLESVGDNGTQDELKRLEGVWGDRLQSWVPLGLDTRDD